MSYDQLDTASSSGTGSTSDPFVASYGQCGCAQCRAALGDLSSATTASLADPLAAPVSATIPSGNTNIDALLAGNSYRWNYGSAVGTAVNLTYSFLTSVPSYYASNAAERSGFQAVTAGMQAGIQNALAFYEQVANVKFTYDASGNGQLTFGQCSMGSSSAAYAYYAMTGGQSVAGDVWYNADYGVNQTQTAGSYGYMTSLHEIGHALGLKHPGNYNAGGGGTAGPYLPPSTDNVTYTVMSYYGGTLSLANPQTLQLYDIQAIQYLYGANTSWHSGSDTYSFSNSSPTVMTIWDGGGTDTLDASNQTYAAYIDLNAGSFCSIGVNASGGAANQNIAIAYNVTIENALGGSGNDTLIGNAADNTLTGGAGNDSINGGNGTNTAVYTGNRSEYGATLTNGVVKVIDRVNGRDGSDSLTNVQYLKFADQTVATSTLQPNKAPTLTAGPKALGSGQTVALSTLVSATDPEGDALTYYISDPTGGGQLNLNGATNQLSAAQQAAGNYQVSAADLAKLTYTGKGSENLTVWAYDGTVWSAPQTLSITNSAPTVTATAKALGSGQTVALSTLVSATDPEGDALTYYIADPTGAGKLNLNGAVNQLGATQQAAGNYQVSAADFAKLTYTGGGSENLTVWVSDGGPWSAPKTLSITNSAPTVTTTAKALGSGQTVTLSTLVSASDADGDTVSLYYISDPAGGGKLNLNGAVNQLGATQQAAGNYQVTAADFAKLTYTGGGSEQLTVWVSAGGQWSAPQTLSIINNAPTLTVTPKALGIGQSVALSTLVSATDAEGDTITKYYITDPTGGGKLNLNGAVNQLGATQQAAGNYQVSAADFAKLTYTGGGSEQLAVSVHDGLQWSAPKTLSITNSVPTLTVTPKVLGIGQSVALSTLVSATDAEGDALTYYISDPAGAGQISLNGAVNQLGAAQQAAGNYQVSAADLAKLTYTGKGGEQLTVWASDGGPWSAPKTLSIGNNAPTMTVTPKALGIGQTVALSTLVSASDAEGDTVSLYYISDPTGGGKLNLNGAVNQLGATQQAAGNYQVTAADFAKLTYTGGGSENLTVWASDGGQWSAAQTLSITNSAPTMMVTPKALSIGQTVALSTLVNASDADGDTVSLYYITDPTGGGKLNLNGAVNQLGAGNYQVTAADFAKLTYTGGGSENLTVWASDGGQWSAPKTLSITNNAPLITASAQKVGVGQSVALSTLVSATDADGDTVSLYYISDPTGAGQINLNDAANQLGATQQAAGNYQVSASDLGKLTYTGGGSEQLTVRAYDGLQWGTAAVTVSNLAPVMTPAPEMRLKFGETVSLSSMFSVTDPNGDPITSYYIRDRNPLNGGTLNLNGATNMLDSTQENRGYYQFSADDFAKVTFTSGGGAFLNVKAYDGEDWSNEALLSVINAFPVVTPLSRSVKVGETIDLSTLFSVTDYEGDAIAFISVTDPTRGTLNLNGAINVQTYETMVPSSKYTAADFNKITYTYTGGGPELLHIRADQGFGTGDVWYYVTGCGDADVQITNAAPVVEALPQTLNPGQTVNASALFGLTDAEGDEMTRYAIKDPTGGGSLNLNGATNLASEADQAEGLYEFSAADLAKVTYTSGGREELSIRAYDGGQWSNSASVLMNSGAPVLTTAPRSLKAHQTVNLSTLFKTADTGGLPVVLYSIQDPAGGGGVNLNGATNMASAADQAAGTYWVLGADIGKVTYTAGTTEQLKISAYDGSQWGNTVAVSLTNAAPTVSVKPEMYSNQNPLYVYGENPFHIADILDVSDPESDSITRYEIYAPPEKGVMTMNGAVNLANEADQAKGKYLVSAADLAKLTYVFDSKLSLIDKPSLPDGANMLISAYDGVQWSKPGSIGTPMFG